MVIYLAIKMERSAVLRLRYFNLFTLNARPESVADRLSLNRVNSVTCTALSEYRYTDAYAKRSALNWSVANKEGILTRRRQDDKSNYVENNALCHAFLIIHLLRTWRQCIERGWRDTRDKNKKRGRRGEQKAEKVSDKFSLCGDSPRQTRQEWRRESNQISGLNRGGGLALVNVSSSR